MSEVAIRLAEPDRTAEQSIASLGQAVRRQVSFMNDAVSRALGRAGELEALVHNHVAELERSYEQNERRIRDLIKELERRAPRPRRHVDERHRYAEDARHRNSDADREAVDAAGHALAASSPAPAKISQSRRLARDRNRTLRRRRRLAHAAAAERCSRTTRRPFQRRSAREPSRCASTFDGYMQTLDTTLGNRTENLQTVFEEYARALDTTLVQPRSGPRHPARSSARDRSTTRSSGGLNSSTTRSSARRQAIDHAVSEKASLLSNALELHSRTFRDTIAQQASDLDDSVMNGINAVRQHQREHHAPYDEGDRRVGEAVGRPAERCGDPLLANPRRHRPLRKPGRADPEGGERSRYGELRIDTTCSRAMPSCRIRSTASRAKPTSSAVRSPAIPPISKAR